MARRQSTYAVRFKSEGGKELAGELVFIGDQTDKSLKKASTSAKGFSGNLRTIGTTAGIITGPLGGVASRFSGFATILDRVNNPLGLLAAGGVAAGAGLTALSVSAVTVADTLAKAADRAGFGVEALQEYRFVADRAGLTTQQLDDSLRRFTRRIGLAAKGTGEARNEYERLKISVIDANGNVRRSEDVLDDVIGKLSEFGSEAEASASASLLFGEDAGPQLAVALREGNAAIQRQRELARDLGLVMRNDIVRNAEEAKDEMSALGQVVRTQTTASLLELAPAITGVSRAWLFLLRQLGQTVQETFVEDLERTSTSLRGELEAIDREIQNIRSGVSAGPTGPTLFGVLSEEIADLFGAGPESQIEALRARVIEVRRLLAERGRRAALAGPDDRGGAQPASTDTAGFTPRARPPIGEILPGNLVEVVRQTDAAIAAQRKAAEVAGGVIKAEQEAIRAEVTATAKAQADLARRGEGVFRSTRTSAEAYQAALADLNELLQANVIDTTTFERASAQAWRASLEASREFKDGAALALIEFGEGATNAAELAKSGVTGAFEGMEDAVAQFAATGKLEIAGFVNAAIADFARLAIRTAITGPLANAFAAAFAPTPAPTGSAGSGPVLTPVLHGGGVPGQDPVPARAVSAALFRRAPHFRRGGVANDEFPAILHRGEGVFTPAQMRALGPAAAPQITVINQAPDQVQVEAQRGGNPQDLLVFIKRAVVDDIANGGQIGREIDRSFVTARRTGLRG